MSDFFHVQILVHFNGWGIRTISKQAINWFIKNTKQATKKQADIWRVKANSYFCFEPKENCHQFKGEKNSTIGQNTIHLKIPDSCCTKQF